MTRLFKEDSVVIRPPSYLLPKQRIAIEGIAFCVRTAMAALEDVRSITENLEVKPDEIGPYPDKESLLLYSAIWTVVDQIHMLRQLLRYVTKNFSQNGHWEAFYKKYEIAKKLRDKMDHLKDNINNLAAMKNGLPIFGVFSFFRFTGPRSGFVAVIPFGTIQPGHKFPVVDALDEKEPRKGITGSFQFIAFDLTFNFYTLFQDLPWFANSFEKSIEASIATIATEHPDLIQMSPGRVWAILKAEF